MPRDIRPAFSVLWQVDLALADVVATSSDPRLGAIRLAWWRERLEQLEANGPAPAEPRLQAVAAELLPRGVTGAEVSKLEDAWLPLLEPFPWGQEQGSGLKLRGRILFRVGARLLGAPPADAELAGEIWALVDGAEHCSDDASRNYLLGTAKALALRAKAPARLRPLTVLAAIARADLNRSGTFGRGAAAIGHRLTGRFPRA